MASCGNADGTMRGLYSVQFFIFNACDRHQVERKREVGGICIFILFDILTEFILCQNKDFSRTAACMLMFLSWIVTDGLTGQPMSAAYPASTTCLGSLLGLL